MPDRAYKATLAALLGGEKTPAFPTPFEPAKLWTANNNARDYAIIGDPAVQLPKV